MLTLWVISGDPRWIRAHQREVICSGYGGRIRGIQDRRISTWVAPDDTDEQVRELFLATGIFRVTLMEGSAVVLIWHARMYVVVIACVCGFRRYVCRYFVMIS